MEIGNHSIYHKDMSRMTPAQLQAEIGGAHKAILEAVPNAKIQAIALPMGKYPRNKSHWKYLTHGTFEGVTYRYKAAMKAQFRAIPAPANKAYDPLRLERIDSIDGRWGVRWWIQELSRGSSAFPRYVSDGDPKFVSIPKGTERLVNVAALGAQKQILNAYSPFGESGGAKPIVGAAGGAGVKETTAPAASGSVTPAVASKPITGG
jgi:peptidoglycan/xylan/chitin deacetylase (PgdA/CDA1 family)